MAANFSGKDRNFSLIFISIIKAAVAGAAISALLLLLFSLFLSKYDIPLWMINPLTSLLLAIASFSGGYFSAKTVKQRGIAVGAGCGGIVFLFILLLSFMNSFEIGIAALTKCSVSVLAGAIGGVLGVNTKRKRK